MIIYILSVAAALLLAFLCGSIPVALIVGQSMRGIDVREHGSGNAGSTNAVRVLGLGPGLLVFAGDVLKGALGSVITVLAVGIAITVASTEAMEYALQASLGSEVLEFDPIVSILAGGYSSFLYDIPKALAVIAAVLGHMFSPFMGFKGGKGVATTLGAMLVIMPFAALSALAVFTVIVLISRLVSLASIAAVISVPLFVFIFYPSPTFIVFSLILAVVVVWAHRKNIVRLSKGEEPKFSMAKKNKEAKAGAAAGGKAKAADALAGREVAEIDAAFADEAHIEADEPAGVSGVTEALGASEISGVIEETRE